MTRISTEPNCLYDGYDADDGRAGVFHEARRVVESAQHPIQVLNSCLGESGEEVDEEIGTERDR